MGHNIKYIATKNNLQVPPEIVHFVEMDTLILPIDLYDSDYEELIEESINWTNSDQLFGHCISELILEDSVLSCIDFLKNQKNLTFALVAYREIMDIPQGYPWLLFKNGQLFKPENKYLEPHSQIGLELRYETIIGNEDRYYSYDDSFYEYFKNQPEKKLVRKYE